MSKPLDLAGVRFGRLTAIRPDSQTEQGVLWECRCTCGRTVVLHGKRLRYGRVKSCGCLRRELTAKKQFKHGHARGRGCCLATPEYRAWAHIISRCTNSNTCDWPNYGGRGITVCKRWRRSFQNFLSDMGPRPVGTSIDRKNNDGNYEPSNCRWATKVQQARNRRPRRNL